MNVAIVGFSDKEWNILCEKMEELISNSQCFLFNVLCGHGSIGEKWAQENGAPIKYIEPDIDKIIKEADFLVANYEGSTAMHRLIFKFKQTGKHGRIVQNVPWD